MNIGHSQIEVFLKEKSPRIQSSINIIESLIENAELNGLPVYKWHHRIKSPTSTFLKIKKKNKSCLEEITDYGGLRILCLCEQDLFDVHNYFIKSIPQEFVLREFLTFNWNGMNEPERERILRYSAISEKYEQCKIDSIRSPSGYKSFHYLLETTQGFHIEIQLRTLIQDVWSELEHRMAYKGGNENAQIKQNFRVIANHLEAIDAVVANIKDIKDKDSATSIEYMKKLGPLVVFTHTPCILEKEYRNGDYKKYMSLLSTQRKFRRNETESWITKGFELFNKISDPIKNENINSQYWKSCEKAFWSFWKGVPPYETALSDYNLILNDDDYKNKVKRYDNDRYLTHFRIGEIQFANGLTKEAFEAFDLCEKFMPTGKINKSDKRNLYKVTVQLAYFYWRLGAAYSNQSLLYMDKALQWADSDNSLNRCNFLNSKAWYLLELYWQNEEKPKSILNGNEGYDNEYLVPLEKAFEELENCVTALSSELHNSNMFHTMACVGFELFKRYIRNSPDEHGDLLDRVYSYCNTCVEITNGNSAYNLEYSISLQRHYIEDILMSYERYNRSRYL